MDEILALQKENECLKEMLNTKISKIDPAPSEAIVFTFGDKFTIEDTYNYYKIVKSAFPDNVVVGIPNSTLLQALGEKALRSSIDTIELAISQLK